jgi:phosphomannomutase
MRFPNGSLIVRVSRSTPLFRLYVYSGGSQSSNQAVEVAAAKSRMRFSRGMKILIDAKMQL